MMIVKGLDGTEYEVSSRFIDFTGKTSGKLEVLGISHRDGKHFLYKCKCFCGREKIINNRELKSGQASSCGCVSLGRAKDLSGQTIGNLTVIERDFGPNINQGKKGAYWACQCACGNICTKFGQQLLNGDGLHCGCVTDRQNSRLDIVGKRFGACVAVRSTEEKSSTGNFIWEFLCDCGNTFVQPSGNIVHRGKGCCPECVKINNAVATRKAKTIHGMSKTKEYKSWSHAKERCFNPDCASYSEYGGMGITMLKEWVESFEAFISHIGLMPLDGKRYTVDRIDHTGNYEPGNVRWATDAQQARNKGKMSNNTSGVTGVHVDEKVHPSGKTSTTYAVAQWHDIDGKLCKKSFSYKKYGEELAFLAACEARDQAIRLLNLQGAQYSENHGK